MRWGVLAALVAGVPLMAAAAQTESASPKVQLFGKLLTRGQTAATFLDAVEHDFADLRAGRNEALSEADIAVHEQMLHAAARAALTSRIMVMDLDGDGIVTQNELRRVLLYQYRAGVAARENEFEPFLARAIAQWLKYDTNRDGRIDLQEARTLPEPGSLEDRLVRNRGVEKRLERLKLALKLDSDGDGRVTPAEYKTAAEAVFHTADSDGDAHISPEELKSYRATETEPADETRRLIDEAARDRREKRVKAKLEREAAKEAEKAAKKAAEEANCAMPNASAEAEVIVLGTYQGEGLSSVAIGTQDKTVQTANIVVEPGEAPLYVVVVSHDPMIWRLSGAVQRVERLVLGALVSAPGPEGARVPLVGETGLPADRVTFLGDPKCIRYFTETPSIGSAKAAGAVRERSGKSPATIAGRYSVWAFSVPSGEIRAVSRKHEGALIIVEGARTVRIDADSDTLTLKTGHLEPGSELSRFHPGGVIEIDPNTVVASLAPEPYVVLPEEAGLRQLLQEGALTVNGRGEYLIHEKIRFPAGLAGAHRATFLLLTGVPVPDGDPGHSVVVSEETGETLIDPFKH